MYKISFIKSLLQFNMRVLDQGNMIKGNYTMNELKRKLFFNSIFISNTNEMFQKYDLSDVMDDYINSFDKYTCNIKIIMKYISNFDNIIIGEDDCFEKRLMTENILSNKVITNHFYDMNNFSYNFMDGVLYYITILEDHIIISFIDNKRSVYNNIIKCDFNDHCTYWKTDRCIKDYIVNEFGEDTIIIKVVSSIKNGSITKVEYNGSSELMKSIIDIFPESALVIYNPFIYTDDIKMLIDSNIKPEVERNKFKPMDFNLINIQDYLIEYPYDSFDDYLHLLKKSFEYEVKEIYLTLYRIGNDPAIFYILRDAVNMGIKVHVNIELYASGEERINRMWLKEMKGIGVHVTTYEAGELKVHSKVTLIKFKNENKMISQIGTGNYHSKTTSQYTDLSLITSDIVICKEIEKMFDLFDGRLVTKFTDDLLVTRYNLRNKLYELIDNESCKGTNGYIAIKCNALDDDEIISHLNNASKNGCRIDAVIRGVCTWVPHNRNVTIKSIIWDKLEHSRVYCFGRSNPTIYLGSLDLVTKKIDKRIETLVKIKNQNIKIGICKYLNRYINNKKDSWVMTRNGAYIKE